MQITVQESKILKTGTNKNGEWELIKVVSDDNTEYTTFDKAAKQGSGAILDFELIIKEGKLSFKECTVVKEGQASSSSETNQSGMTKEGWAEKDRIQLDAKFRNTALMTAGEKCDPGMDTVETADLYYSWLTGNLTVDNLKLIKKAMQKPTQTPIRDTEKPIEATEREDEGDSLGAAVKERLAEDLEFWRDTVNQIAKKKKWRTFDVGEIVEKNFIARSLGALGPEELQKLASIMEGM